MSAPSDGARADARKARAVERVAADERVVTVLDEHFIMWRDLEDKEGPPGEWYCSCGAKFGFSYTAIRHVAEALAGVIADAKAEALREAADSLEGRLGTKGTPSNLYEFRVWLRVRGARFQSEEIR